MIQRLLLSFCLLLAGGTASAADAVGNAAKGFHQPSTVAQKPTDNTVTLCQVLSTPEDDLWNFQLPDGRGIRQAVAYLYPFLADKSKWPLKPDVQAWDGWPARQSSLLFAGLAFDEPRYLELWQKLPPDPADEEVRRNIAITQPLLWLDLLSAASS